MKQLGFLELECIEEEQGKALCKGEPIGMLCQIEFEGKSFEYALYSGIDKLYATDDNKEHNIEDIDIDNSLIDYRVFIYKTTDGYYIIHYEFVNRFYYITKPNWFDVY